MGVLSRKDTSQLQVAWMELQANQSGDSHLGFCIGSKDVRIYVANTISTFIFMSILSKYLYIYSNMHIHMQKLHETHFVKPTEI